MASDFGIDQVSDIFESAYGKPLEDGAHELWKTLFGDVNDADLVKAAYRLVKTREKTSKVSPGEIKAVLDRLIGYSGPSNDFNNDPAVRALNRHYQAMQDLPGITMNEWLREEGLSSFQEAMDRYGDRPSSAELLLQLVQPKEEAPF